MFLTSAWSETPTIVNIARLTRFKAFLCTEVLIDSRPRRLGHMRTCAINAMMCAYKFTYMYESVFPFLVHTIELKNVHKLNFY